MSDPLTGIEIGLCHFNVRNNPPKYLRYYYYIHQLVRKEHVEFYNNIVSIAGNFYIDKIGLIQIYTDTILLYVNVIGR